MHFALQTNTFCNAKCENSGSLRTEPGTGNRTDLEPEPAEPDTEPEPAEPEPAKMKSLANPQKSKKVQKSIQNQRITSPHPAKKRGLGPLGAPGVPPSLFGGVGRCYSLILDGGGMLFFDFGWIFVLFLIFGGWPKFPFFRSKPEPAEPELAAVGTEPNRTESWVSCN